MRGKGSRKFRIVFDKVIVRVYVLYVLKGVRKRYMGLEFFISWMWIISGSGMMVERI